jgi:hypothetical protein
LITLHTRGFEYGIHIGRNLGNTKSGKHVTSRHKMYIVVYRRQTTASLWGQMALAFEGDVGQGGTKFLRCVGCPPSLSAGHSCGENAAETE